MLGFNDDFGGLITEDLQNSIQAKQRVIDGEIATLHQIAQLLLGTLEAGKKILIFGNGGSAADSQHIAGELVSKFQRERQALAAMALTTDTSILTSIGNDYGYDYIFARQIEALGQEGDVAWGISTSGNSPNVLRAVKTARARGLVTLGFTGQDGGELKNLVDVCFCAPSPSTPRIQEVHITVAHALCELVERAFCATPA